MERSLDRLPGYLRLYCTEHDTSRYTARDHAAWRYIMRRAQDFFQEHAVHTYHDGFRQTGLTIDRIPHVDEIDRALQAVGWGAVPVVGFIAPWAFIEFQARKILPIATDMRSVDHIAYTPAPDIVHEAAGHAPIIPDKDYSDYLAYYASLGSKALYSSQDLMLYEAVRYLSDIKEKPESTPEIIARAEERLQLTLKALTYTSEQVLVARMSWWTAEYGLAGSLQNPKIYGAGLLSSVGESKIAMTDRVKKIRLSLDCIQYSYNITEPQPQLFVADSMQHLHDVLHELDALLSYKRGGLASLEKAKACEAISTTCLDTQIAVTGRLVAMEHQGERIDFLKWEGPVQLSVDRKQLTGQGIERHPHGFSSPIGRLSKYPDRPFSQLSDLDCERLHLRPGQRCHLTYISGFELQGNVVAIHRQQGKILFISFDHCQVKRGDQIYFDPSWGEFDLIVGDTVPSVYGGPADRETYGEHEITDPQSSPARELPYSQHEKAAFKVYGELRQLRDSWGKAGHASWQSLESLSSRVLQDFPEEWLLHLEVYELGREKAQTSQQKSLWLQQLQQGLQDKQRWAQEKQDLIQEGLRLIPGTSLL